MEAIKVTYNNKDISENIAKYLLSVTYNDKNGSESDEITLSIEDIEGKWLSDWYPEKGDIVSVDIGNLSCGAFEIDDIEFIPNPSTVNIRGLATNYSTKTLRTKKITAHENKKLSEIIKSVASSNKLTVSGTLRSDLLIKRKTQKNITDLEFLNDLGKKYGYTFSVRGDKLYFYDTYKLESTDAIKDISIKDISPNSTFRDKTSEVYSSARVSHFNAKKGLKVEAVVSDSKKSDFTDTLEVKSSSTNTGEAKEIATAALYEKNSEKITASVSMQGDTSIMSGICVNLSDAGKLSGKYYVKDSSHIVTRIEGYITSFQAKKVG